MLSFSIGWGVSVELVRDLGERPAAQRPATAHRLCTPGPGHFRAPATFDSQHLPDDARGSALDRDSQSPWRTSRGGRPAGRSQGHGLRSRSASTRPDTPCTSPRYMLPRRKPPPSMRTTRPTGHQYSQHHLPALARLAETGKPVEECRRHCHESRFRRCHQGSSFRRSKSARSHPVSFSSTSSTDSAAKLLTKLRGFLISCANTGRELTERSEFLGLHKAVLRVTKIV
jgi:hypothetical protein